MSSRSIVSTDKAPAAIGPYSQAVKSGSLVFLSGQIPLVPETMEMVTGGIAAQAHQVMKNLSAVAAAAGGSLDNIVKLTIFMTDLGDFATVNDVMTGYFSEPYPARATIQVSALPRGAAVEIDGIMEL